jgi:hypothetical protein
MHAELIGAIQNRSRPFFQFEVFVDRGFGDLPIAVGCPGQYAEIPLSRWCPIELVDIKEPTLSSRLMSLHLNAVHPDIYRRKRVFVGDGDLIGN